MPPKTMNLSPVVSAAAGVIVTTMINAIIDPVGRAYDRRAKRIQHWKSVIEAAPLIGIRDGDELEQIKAMYRAELVGAYDDVQKFRNRLARTAANLITLTILTALLVAVTETMTQTADHSTNQTPRNIFGQIGYAVFWAEIVAAFLLWFFARPKIRDVVWSRLLKPGKSLSFCLNDETYMRRAEVVLLMIFLPFIFWLSSQMGAGR